MTARITVPVPFSAIPSEAFGDLENHFIEKSGGKILSVGLGELIELKDRTLGAMIQFEFSDDETAVWFKLSWPEVR